MGNRKKIKIKGATPVSTAKDQNKWKPPFTQILLPGLAFGMALALGYWWWGGGKTVESSVAVREQTETIPAKIMENMVEGVFRDSVPLSTLLQNLVVTRQSREYLLSQPELGEAPAVPAGRPYRLVYGQDIDRTPRSFSYERDSATLIKLRFQPYPDVEVVERRIESRSAVYAGIITKNFWLAVLESDSLHHSLIPLAEEALKWTVDLFHLVPGDRFKIAYTELLRDGEVLGIERLDAIMIETRERTHTVYGYPVTQDSTLYLDHQGRTLQRRFLRAPVKFGIVSSPFSPSRPHPVTGKVKRHGGTDYAAPAGTPIHALADGVVYRQSEDLFNGKFVEIRHDETYGTMYLHMRDFAPELKRGSRVRQGQVIGYVGSTGQSTGPHVCLRFRENGKEVDFQQQKNRESVALFRGNVSSYFSHRDSLADRLDMLSYRGILF